jgi:flavin-dependent thymidylate synthase
MLSVKLISATEQPLNLAIASARTCYSSKGIITPEEVSANIELRDSIAKSTFQAGHLTTRQHVQFVFAISGISRQAIWEFFHSHQYYNSEQVSQRYVEVKDNNYYVPLHLKGHDLQYYTNANNARISDYLELIRLLTPVVSEEFFRVFPARSSKPDKWKSAIHKKVIELARYVLPVSTTAYMYHTINALTLYRYARMYSVYDTRDELKQIIDRMISEVSKLDPDFAKEIPGPVDETVKIDYTPLDSKSLFNLISKAQPSYLLDTNIGTRHISNSISSILGCKEEDIFKILLNPLSNSHISSNINEALLSRENRALSMYNLSFLKVLSHTADSQNQRHRTTVALRSKLFDTFDLNLGPIIPEIINSNRTIKDFYLRSIERSYRNINKMRRSDPVSAMYLFPNAHPVFMIETGDLLSYYHKWKLRLCYNAQDEIFRSAVAEVKQVNEFIPYFTDYLRAPCYVRKLKGITPYCPEGNRYCGKPVWNQELEKYDRLI